MAQTDAPPSPIEPDVQEVSLDVDSVHWIVRVLGRSGGSGPGATPLLLLGFWEGDRAGGDASRDTLVVGRALSDLSIASLERALAGARPYSRETRRGGLFVDASERRRR